MSSYNGDMRKLWLTSAFAVAILTGLLITVATLVELFAKAPPGLMPFTVGFSLVIVLLQFLLGPYFIRLILKIGWCAPSEVSPEFGQWYRETAAGLNIGCPQFGIIESGMPNAFTFGRLVSDARVVVTRGLVDSLDEQELRAVVTHEFGHIRNRDFVAMTLVQALVLIIYYCARMLLQNSDHKIKVAGLIAYAIYWVAELGALAFSRIREFMADRVSAATTHDPDALASALVKIGYGLARVKNEEEAAAKAAAKSKDKNARRRPAFGAGALGAWGIAAAAPFDAVAGWGGLDGRPTPEAFSRVSSWDLKNVWARYGELWSTHPLIARRVATLMALPQSRHTFRVGAFERPNWPKFLKEYAIYSLPGIAMIVTWLLLISREITHPWMLAAGFIALFAGLGIRMLLVYPSSDFRSQTVIDLLSDTESSHVAPIPCKLRGQFVTRAEGGLWWSANLVFQDETGIIVAQRKMFLPPILTMWGWVRAQQLVGTGEVEVTGWYRRFGHPCVEVNTIRNVASGEEFRSPYWSRAMGMIALGLVVSIVVLALSMM